MSDDDIKTSLHARRHLSKPPERLRSLIMPGTFYTLAEEAVYVQRSNAAVRRRPYGLSFMGNQ